MKDIETIVIPSGGSDEIDMRRLKTGIEYGEKLKIDGANVRYLVSGIGPDLDKRINEYNDNGREYHEGSRVIRQGYFFGTKSLDVHEKLWNYAIVLTKRESAVNGKFIPFGIDTLSRNSVENIMNSFPKEQEGKYTIVSRRLHNLRFRMIERWGRRKELLSENLSLSYLNTKEKFSLKNTFYDFLSLGKEVLREIFR